MPPDPVHGHSVYAFLLLPGRSTFGLATQIMEINIEDPFAPTRSPRWSACPPGNSNGCFSHCLGVSQNRHYLQLRLNKARHVLRQRDMSVTEVSVAFRFRTLSHLSKSYREAFGSSPVRDAADPAQFW